MKITILLFANLILIGAAIGLYLDRSTESRIASPAASPGTSAPIPPETPPPWDRGDSNASVDGGGSNAVPERVPRTNATRQNQFAAAMEKDLASTCSIF
jgi:hypothetical protein